VAWDWYWSTLELKVPTGIRQVAVQLNILSGVLLVEGAHPGLLPSSMITNRDIKRVFGNRQLRVQQEDRGKYSCTIYDAAQKKLFYTFEGTTKNGVKITRREPVKMEVWRLIPLVALSDDLPPVLLASC
jgi:hypothetical protein